MAGNKTDLGRAFARRIFGPRALGCALSFIFVATVSATQPHVGTWLWVLMLTNAFIWPSLAFLIAVRSHKPYTVERYNLVIDALFAGFWVAQMAFNLLPTVLLLAMINMNAVAAGGWRLLRQALPLQLAGVLVGIATTGLRLAPQTYPHEMLACLPMLIVYPFVVGLASYRVAVQLAEHKKAFKLISTLDGMTNLLHQTAWMGKLRETFHHCRYEQQGAVLALLDIDDFKVINDTHGHLVGDAIISRLANLLRAGLTPECLPGRYGGDEFCVIFVGVTVSEAYKQLDDIRKRFGAWSDGATAARTSVSIGLVPYSYKYTSEREWLQAADEALYAAKRSGKDRVKLQELTAV